MQLGLVGLGGSVAKLGLSTVFGCDRTGLDWQADIKPTAARSQETLTAIGV